jgi:hypothetical protein
MNALNADGFDRAAAKKWLYFPCEDGSYFIQIATGFPLDAEKGGKAGMMRILESVYSFPQLVIPASWPW